MQRCSTSILRTYHRRGFLIELHVHGRRANRYDERARRRMKSKPSMRSIYLADCWESCSSFLRCSTSTVFSMSLIVDMYALNYRSNAAEMHERRTFTCCRFRLVSMEIGTRKGMTLVASISRGRPPDFEEDMATLMIPKTPMRTAGSRDGIAWSRGITSSMMIHLSNDSTSFPRHIKPFTRT